MSSIVTKTSKLACLSEVCATVDDPPLVKSLKHVITVCIAPPAAVLSSLHYVCLSVCPTRLMLAISAVCFPEQQSFIGLCDGECECFLLGANWLFR